MMDLRQIKIGEVLYFYLYTFQDNKEYTKLLGKESPKDLEAEKQLFQEEINNHQRIPYKQPEQNVIEILEDVQKQHGFLPKDELLRISKELGIPGTDIFGVATFYSFFTLNQPAKYTIKVCDGTACHVRGSDKLLAEIKKELDITPNETTKDGLCKLEIVRCLGLCASAPLLTINEELHPKLAPKDIKDILATIKKTGLSCKVEENNTVKENKEGQIAQ